MSSDSLYIKRNRTVTKTLDASYTRPGDTSVYAAGDVVANSTSAATILTFSGAARAAGMGGLILGATLIDSLAQTTKPEFELYLFDTAPAMQNDNVAWAPSDAELEKCIGYIGFPGALFRTTSNGGLIYVPGLFVPYACAAGSTNLYGICVSRNAYTPGNAEKLNFRLFAEVN